MLKSIVAIVVGFLLVTVLSGTADVVLMKAMPQAVHGGHFDDPVACAIILIYGLVFATIGAYVTARLAPHHPLRHALILGGIAFVLTLVVTLKLWGVAPPWYNLGSLIVPLLAAYLGGSLRETQLRKPSATA